MHDAIIANAIRPVLNDKEFQTGLRTRSIFNRVQIIRVRVQETFASSSSAQMIEFEFKFEFTALFKIPFKQTYPNQERIQKILVGVQF